MLKHSKKIFAGNLAALAAILAFAAAGYGQTDEARKCPAIGGDVPFLSQVSLGMTPQEISKLLNLPIKTEPKQTIVMVEQAGDAAAPVNTGTKVRREVAAGETVFRYSNSPAKNILGVAGIHGIGLEFYKDRMYSFSMYYQSPDVKWKDAAEFAAMASERLNLPKDFWRVNDGVAALTCQNFHITANVSVENKVLLIFYNPAILAEIQLEAKRLASTQN